MTRVPFLLLLTVLLAACAVPEPPVDPFADLRTTDGKVAWQGEYEFLPPPPPWELLMLDEDDYSLAFFRACDDGPPALFPCESTMAYAEEPFGFSRELGLRQEEFFRRFLWAARVEFDPPVLQSTQALGGKALWAETVGRERVLDQKVLVRVLFSHRGERVVAFYFTQWRPAGEEFDRTQFGAFEEFINTFRFTSPSFFQQLQEN